MSDKCRIGASNAGKTCDPIKFENVKGLSVTCDGETYPLDGFELKVTDGKEFWRHNGKRSRVAGECIDRWLDLARRLSNEVPRDQSVSEVKGSDVADGKKSENSKEANKKTEKKVFTKVVESDTRITAQGNCSTTAAHRTASAKRNVKNRASEKICGCPSVKSFEFFGNRAKDNDGVIINVNSSKQDKESCTSDGHSGARVKATIEIEEGTEVPCDCTHVMKGK